MDYVDIYQIHRWDYQTPIEETLEALNDVVRMGKARYIGASSMFAWQFAQALYTSDRHGWTRFASMQPYYNLAYREEEREMLPLCRDQGIAVIPWSPLGRGLLTGGGGKAQASPPRGCPALPSAPRPTFFRKFYTPTTTILWLPPAWRKWLRSAACRPPRWRWRGY